MDYKPLYISLTLIFVIGVVIPFILAGIVDLNEIQTSNVVVTPIINFVNNGFSLNFLGLGNFSFNIFDFFGETLKQSLITYLSYFGLIPEVIIIPYIIIVLVGIVYTIVKMLPTT